MAPTAPSALDRFGGALHGAGHAATDDPRLSSRSASPSTSGEESRGATPEPRPMHKPASEAASSHEAGALPAPAEALLPAAVDAPSPSSSSSPAPPADEGSRPPARPPSKKRAAAEEVEVEAVGDEPLAALGAPGFLLGQQLRWAFPDSSLLKLTVRAFRTGGGNGYLCFEGEHGEVSRLYFERGSEPMVVQAGRHVAVANVKAVATAASRAARHRAEVSSVLRDLVAQVVEAHETPPESPAPQLEFTPYHRSTLTKAASVTLELAPLPMTPPFPPLPRGVAWHAKGGGEARGIIRVEPGQVVECGSFRQENFSRQGAFCRLVSPDPAWRSLVFSVKTASLCAPPAGWPASANEKRGSVCDGPGARERRREYGRAVREGAGPGSSEAAANVVRVASAERHLAATEASLPVHALLRLGSEASAAELAARLITGIAGARASDARWDSKAAL